MSFFFSVNTLLKFAVLCIILINIHGELRFNKIYKFSQQSIKVANTLVHNKFPEDFLFGAVTKFADIRLYENSETYNHESLFVKYVDDFQYTKFAKGKVIKFPIIWSSVIPNGTVSEANLEFYDYFIDLIIQNGMIPMITLFDINAPWSYDTFSGWTDSSTIELFSQYARIAFSRFGDKVKYWITIDEPNIACSVLRRITGLLNYTCGHNMLLAHSNVYRMYQREFQTKQQGKVGISYQLTHFEPENETNPEDILAAERAHTWYNDWLVHPLFSETGDYPDSMKQLKIYRNIFQGYPISTVPEFTREQITQLKKSADFIGIDFFASGTVSSFSHNSITGNLENSGDFIIKDHASDVFKYPKSGDGFKKLFHRLNNDYLLPEIYITGNGNSLVPYRDELSTEYLQRYAKEVLKAIQNGVDIRGYLALTFIHNDDVLKAFTTKDMLTFAEKVERLYRYRVI